MPRAGTETLQKVGAVLASNVLLYDASGNALLHADDSAFTPGTHSVMPVGMLADETSPDSVDEGDIGIPRMTLSRILWAGLRAKGTVSADTELLADATYGLRVGPYTVEANEVDGSGNQSYYPISYAGNMIRHFSRIAAFNGTTWDRLRTIAASGAGLGVQQVGTLGESVTLAASAARTTSANGSAVTGLGWRRRYVVLADVTVLSGTGGDQLELYVDVLGPDGTTYINAIHFTSLIGTDAVRKEWAVLDSAAPGATVTVVTTDAASGVVRPAMFGSALRARWAIVDGGGTHSFTFAIYAFGI